MPDNRVVIIYIAGGLVSAVDKPPDVAVEIIDFDIEGSDDEELCHCEMASDPHFHAEHPAEPVSEAIANWIQEKMEE